MSASLKRSFLISSNQDKFFVKIKELTWLCTNIMSIEIARKFKREIKKQYPNSRVYVRLYYPDLSWNKYTVDIKFNNEIDEVEFMLKESL